VRNVCELGQTPGYRAETHTVLGGPKFHTVSARAPILHKDQWRTTKPGSSLSERAEERDEVAHLLGCEADVEALVIEVHHSREILRRAVVEVRCPPREPRSIGPFVFPMSVHLPLSMALPGSVTSTEAPVAGF